MVHRLQTGGDWNTSDEGVHAGEGFGEDEVGMAGFNIHFRALSRLREYFYRRLKPNTRRRHRRDSTRSAVELSRVDGVYGIRN